MKKRIIAGTAAFLAVTMLMTACDSKNGQQQSTTQAQTAAPADERVSKLSLDYYAGSAAEMAVWKDIDPSLTVASVAEGTADKEFFDIPFSEFYNEYMYYLLTNQITDDMSEENKTACEGYRDNIITFMAFERMYMYVAEKDFGITESTLTQEQLDEIQKNSENTRQEWEATFYTAVSEELGESASEEEKNQMCKDVLDYLLVRCNIDSSSFYKWEMSRYIQELVLQKLTEEAGEVSEEDLQAMFDEFYNEAKDKAENAPADYESAAMYSMVYIPEGTRTAKHIFISFPDEDLTNIAQAVSESDTEAAAKIAEAAARDEITAKVNEITEKLAAGTSFDDLRQEYDTVSSDEMLVLRNSPSFFEAYRNALYALENKGDVSEAVICDNGIYFIQYSDDALVLDEYVNSIKESMRSYLQDSKKSAVQNTAYTEWIKRFPYTIDYDTLKINAESALLNNLEQ